MADPRFFKNHGPFTLSELAQRAGATLYGEDIEVKDVGSLQEADEGDISFLTNPKYKSQLKETRASAIVIAEGIAEAVPKGKSALLAKNPHKAYALVAQAFYPLQEEGAGQVHPSAVVDESAKLGKDVIVGPNSVIGANVEIGEGTYIGPNVTLSHCLIGKKCRIFPGVRIGQDGFGFAIDPAGHVTVPQLGRVIIGDMVEIGANTTIDRGAGPDTIIGDNTRIDNLVQIGHNVKIGKSCVIVAQAGIAGSSVIEDYAVIAAQAGVAGHITIGMGAQIGAKSGVPSDVPAGAKMMGSPMKPIKDYWREQVLLKKMLEEHKNKVKSGTNKGDKDNA